MLLIIALSSFLIYAFSVINCTLSTAFTTFLKFRCHVYIWSSVNARYRPFLTVWSVLSLCMAYQISFKCLNFSNKLQIFLSGFIQSIIYLNYNLLPQMSASFSFDLQCFPMSIACPPWMCSKVSETETTSSSSSPW